MSGNAFVSGVGMTPFVKPSVSRSYVAMAADAVRDALSDAGLEYSDVQQAYVGYVYGDSTSGQAALYTVGMTGIPVVNVNNNCSTGSTALFLARQAIASGAADCVLALGFEQMVPGALSEHYTDRPTPLARFVEIAEDAPGADNAPMAIKLFGAAGYQYQQRYGADDSVFAKISVKARRHAEHNERAVFRNQLTVEEVLASPRMMGPLTRLQCSPPTCGAAAAILVSERFAKAHGLDTRVAIRGQAMTTDFNSTFADRDPMKAVGYDLARAAADKVYTETGVGPEDLDLVELHDCFSANEILTYEALRLTPEGTAARFVNDGDNTYGGKIVTNPSGGLLAKGHPLGATGVAQCAELVWQLRGEAGVRQVEDARIGLQHNIGIGGACVVTLYERSHA
jgi:sterol carrier protein 2